MKVVIIGDPAQNEPLSTDYRSDYFFTLIQELTSDDLREAIEADSSVTKHQQSFDVFAGSQQTNRQYRVQNISYHISKNILSVGRGQPTDLYIIYDDGHLKENLDEIARLQEVSSDKANVVIVADNITAFQLSPRYQAILQDKTLMRRICVSNILTWSDVEVDHSTSIALSSSASSDVSQSQEMGLRQNTLGLLEFGQSGFSMDRRLTYATAEQADMLRLAEPSTARSPLLRELHACIYRHTNRSEKHIVEIPTIDQCHTMMEKLDTLRLDGHGHAQGHMDKLKAASEAYYHLIEMQTIDKAETLNRVTVKVVEYLTSRLKKPTRRENETEIEAIINELKETLKSDSVILSYLEIIEREFLQKKMWWTRPDYVPMFQALENLSLKYDVNQKIEGIKRSVESFLKGKVEHLEKKRLTEQEIGQLSAILEALVAITNNVENTAEIQSLIVRYTAVIETITENMKIRKIMRPFLETSSNESLVEKIRDELYIEQPQAKHSKEFIQVRAITSAFYYYGADENCQIILAEMFPKETRLQQKQKKEGEDLVALSYEEFVPLFNELSPKIAILFHELVNFPYTLDKEPFLSCWRQYQKEGIISTHLFEAYREQKERQDQFIEHHNISIEMTLAMGVYIEKNKIPVENDFRQLDEYFVKLVKRAAICGLDLNIIKEKFAIYSKNRYAAYAEMRLLCHDAHKLCEARENICEDVGTYVSKIDKNLAIPARGDLEKKWENYKELLQSSSFSPDRNEQLSTAFRRLKYSFQRLKNIIIAYENETKKQRKKDVTSSTPPSIVSMPSMASLDSQEDITVLPPSSSSKNTSIILAADHDDGWQQERALVIAATRETVDGEYTLNRHGYTVSYDLMELAKYNGNIHAAVYCYWFDLSLSPEELEKKLEVYFFKNTADIPDDYEEPSCVFVGMNVENMNDDKKLTAFKHVFNKFAINWAEFYVPNAPTQQDDIEEHDSVEGTPEYDQKLILKYIDSAAINVRNYTLRPYSKKLVEQAEKIFNEIDSRGAEYPEVLENQKRLNEARNAYTSAPSLETERALNNIMHNYRTKYRLSPIFSSMMRESLSFSWSNNSIALYGSNESPLKLRSHSELPDDDTKEEDYDIDDFFRNRESPLRIGDYSKATPTAILQLPSYDPESTEVPKLT